MKKKLVTYLLISALAVTVFAGCGKKDDGGDASADGAADAGAVETVVTEDAPEEEVGETPVDAVEEVEEVEETVEAGAVEATTTVEAAAAEMIDAADTAESAVEEYTDETVEEAAETVDAAATGEAAAAEKVVPPNGSQYEVRFGGNVYSTPEANDANIQYFAQPGDILNIVERVNDSSWYKVTYWLAGEGIEHEGYIEIE